MEHTFLFYVTTVCVDINVIPNDCQLLIRITALHLTHHRIYATRKSNSISAKFLLISQRIRDLPKLGDSPNARVWRPWRIRTRVREPSTQHFLVRLIAFLAYVVARARLIETQIHLSARNCSAEQCRFADRNERQKRRRSTEIAREIRLSSNNG